MALSPSRRNPINNTVNWTSISETGLVVHEDTAKGIYVIQLAERPKIETVFFTVTSPGGETLGASYGTTGPTPNECRVDIVNGTGICWCHLDCDGWVVNAVYDGGGSPGNLANIQSLANTASTPIGSIQGYSGIGLPSNYLWCRGASISRSTYSDLFSALTDVLGTCTITQATPAVVTLAGHGFTESGPCISLTTTGALPTPLAINTNYYVIYVDTITFQLATTLDNALSGTAIDTTSAGSGAHTLMHNPFGIDGASDFYLPDLRGAFIRGAGEHGSALMANGSAYSGPPLGVRAYDEFFKHWHNGVLEASYSVQSGSTHPRGLRSKTDTQTDRTDFWGAGDPCSAGAATGDPASGPETRPFNVGMNYIIKYQ